MTQRRPPQVLDDEVVCEATHRGRPLVVAGPPSALGAADAAVGDGLVVGDGGSVSTFFRGFTKTELAGTPAAWNLTFDREVWESRDGWISFTTEQTFLGGVEDPADVVAELRSLAEQLTRLEAVER